MLKDLIDEINSKTELTQKEKEIAIKNVIDMNNDADKFTKYSWSTGLCKRKFSLDNCFYWSDTPQGHDYWDKITNGK